MNSMTEALMKKKVMKAMSQPTYILNSALEELSSGLYEKRRLAWAPGGAERSKDELTYHLSACSTCALLKAFACLPKPLCIASVSVTDPKRIKNLHMVRLTA